MSLSRNGINLVKNSMPHFHRFNVKHNQGVISCICSNCCVQDRKNIEEQIGNGGINMSGFGSSQVEKGGHLG